MKKLELPRGQAEFLFSEADPERLQNWFATNPNITGFCMIGRSNVGKSTLINSLLGKNTARVSKTPGRTREIIAFRFKLEMQVGDQTALKEFYFFDLPGFGHANVSKKMFRNWDQLMGVFFSYLSPAMLILNIQDSRHPHQKADQDFWHFIKGVDANVFLILNKIDKLKTQKERAQLEKLKPNIFKTYKQVKQIHFVSGESKLGIDPLEQSILSFIFQQSNS